jgi:hypothetical protein
VTVSKELSKYKLDFVGVQELRWEGDRRAGEYIFFYEKGNDTHKVGIGFLFIRDLY